MANEALIYGDIYSWTAREFIKSINEFPEDEDVTVRIATNGGEPEYGWSIIAKILENKDRTSVKVDGKAYSMGAFMCCYVDAEALDVAEFLIHRAAYGEWFENDPTLFTDAYRENLKRVNDNLEKAFRAKVDVERFEKMKGVTVDEIFSMDKRVDVFLSAKEAKAIRLINKLTPTTIEAKASIESSKQAFMEKYPEVSIAACFPKNAKKEQNKVIDTVMDINELKEKHPELYAQVAESGKAAATEAGKKAEQARVAAWSEWADVDAEMVKKAIAEGTEMTTTHLSALSKKALTSGYAAKALKEMEEGSEGGLATDEEKSVAKTAKEKELEEWDAKFKAALKLEKA